jgi:bifunctional DNA-binding transcriptional regulator/antitoxin component of YhaV-PrlF toxin-antitoxin module
MANLTVKNRSNKVSPGGVITLPLSARKALGMEPRQGARVTVAAEGDAITLKPTSDRAGTRVSPAGQMELVGDARAILTRGGNSNYWLELDDATRQVILHSYT